MLFPVCHPQHKSGTIIKDNLTCGLFRPRHEGTLDNGPQSNLPDEDLFNRHQRVLIWLARVTLIFLVPLGLLGPN